MKVTTAEIHKNDFSSMSFYGAMNYSVKRIREVIDIYVKLRKVNTSVFGDVHALRLLCEKSNRSDVPIMLAEAKEWEEILLKYFNRIQKKIPENIRSEFEKNLTEDLKIIVSEGKDYPEYLWKEKVPKREITITVKNQELKDKYELLVKEKEEYKDRLGNALHNYILDCLENLDQENPKKTAEKKPDAKAPSFQPTYFKSTLGGFTYMISDFSCFLTKEELENDTEINAYDIEERIKDHLKKVDNKLLKELNFDCESSLFSVQSDTLDNLHILNSHLLSITKFSAL